MPIVLNKPDQDMEICKIKCDLCDRWDISINYFSTPSSKFKARCAKRWRKYGWSISRGYKEVLCNYHMFLKVFPEAVNKIFTKEELELAADELRKTRINKAYHQDQMRALRKTSRTSLRK